MRAVVSVSDKTGVEALARGLVARGVEIYSTGGTEAALGAAGLAVRSVSELTGFPEILGGRVKTLHPGIHGGILARRDDPEHMAELEDRGIEPIDVVAVNLYPFAEVVAAEGVALETALENIDIGGPTLIRAAAKTFTDVVVLTDPADYAPTLGEWERDGAVSLETRRLLATKAFEHVAAYDARIAAYLRGEELFPDEYTLALRKVRELRYGENPHQRAALYREAAGRPDGLAASLRQLGGIELSFNNVLDAELALAAVSDFLGPTVAVVKHGNPCGLATHDDLAVAFRRALAGDPISTFGGVVAANRPIDLRVAEEIGTSRFDLVIAPVIAPEARELLARRKRLRLLEVGPTSGSWERGVGPRILDYKRVGGGFLVQTPDALAPDEVRTEHVAGPAPTLAQTTDLLFAWRAVEHVRSNAIVLAKGLALVGLGAGQPSRVDSVRLAVQKAGDRAAGSVLASDAFFPFSDGVEEAAKAGIAAIIQPGGSVKDDEVLETAHRYGVAMVFTGTRHFRH